MDLFSVYYVHDDASLQHACQSCLCGEGVIAVGGTAICSSGEFSCHLAVIVDHLQWIGRVS